MKKWVLKLWNGSVNLNGIIYAKNYYEACYKAKVFGYPPGYIWTIT